MQKSIEEIRKDFPILNQKIYGKPLVYFDNGATSQKPLCVIDTENEIYKTINSNIHRGVHFLSGEMTNAYEKARQTIQNFINAQLSEEIIFTKGATDSINLVAFSFGEAFVNEGDEIIVTEMEHHANIVPWQMLCLRKKAKLKVLPIDEIGELKINELENLISERTKLLAFAHTSNVLGTINPVKKIIKKAHSKNVKVLVDGSQAILHSSVDVQDLDADFYVFSGHKMYAPTGTGILYGKKEILCQMPPYQGGGDMVDVVSFQETTYAELPFKFEAGTSNFVGSVALARAAEYIKEIGFELITTRENGLLIYATHELKQIKGLKIFGESQKKSSIISFLVDNIHAYDMGLMLDKMGIAVRTGSHCAQPLMQRLGIDGTVRASLAFYNTPEEVDLLVNGVKRIVKLFH